MTNSKIKFYDKVCWEFNYEEIYVIKSELFKKKLLLKTKQEKKEEIILS